MLKKIIIELQGHGDLFKRHNPGLCSLPFQRPQYVNIVLLTGTEDDLPYKDYLLGLSNRWQKLGALAQTDHHRYLLKN